MLPKILIPRNVAKDLTKALNRENFQIAKVPSIFGGAVLAIISKQPKGGELGF